jgi:formylglycine-generating enzyme required for sulfatase activity
MKRIFYSLLAMSGFTASAFANDIQLANTGLANQNTTAHTVEVKFDVNWKNSWRTSTNEANYDGAWVFIKFRKINTSLWQHCSLNTAGFTAPSGSTIKVSSDQKGLWIYASSNIIGDVNYTGAKVVWNYGSNGVLDSDSVEIRVFAVEMVYIPQGSFYMGSGGTENGAFKEGGSTNPFNITSEASINYANTSGNLFSSAGGANFTIPAAVPKGYNAFWIMKYECSQQQYADFLNNLDLVRATFNNPNGAISGTHPNLVCAQPERAMGVSSQGLYDWADWGCLRPMTEFEFEKACRGVNITPLPNEYPWGNSTINNVSTLINTGLSNESQTAPYGNCNYNGIAATRCGLFARSGTGAYRDSSGGTYYGAMDMGGNVWEKCIMIYNNANNLAFTNQNGDGNLSADGSTDIAVWKNSAYCMRGGAYATNNTGFVRTSDRYYGPVLGFADNNNSNIGFRLVRTAE